MAVSRAMGNGNGNGNNRSDSIDTGQVLASFRQAVIERFQISIDNRQYGYRDYLALPVGERSNDEADAVDARFAQATLEWLGFAPPDWSYNRPQAGQKANRPDYAVSALLGTAFIWEDKNSTAELSEEHLRQMRRYCSGTAGYAVWCNMRRILAVRFISSDSLRYETLADIAVERLAGGQALSRELLEAEATNLALFKLLFGKERFTRFSQLADRIAVDEKTFERAAIPLSGQQAKEHFIAESRQSLDHLRLAALSLIQKSLAYYATSEAEEQALQQEWRDELAAFTDRLGYDAIRQPVLEAIQQLTPGLGEITAHDIYRVKQVLERAVGTRRLSVALNTLFEHWLERAIHINGALLLRRFQSAEHARVAHAYRIWSERQSDREDVKPEVFAEQVAYVFFIQLLLVRVLEDKQVLRPRMASDGGFADWRGYVQRHFQELEGIGILNQNYFSLLALKAGHYYLHFFQQAVFDWFIPDDFLLLETLEFLCRYNFQQVDSDIIGFTYEEYIDRTARNRKGHFLTRDEVVDYMLDLLDYQGPQVLERRIFDPACGSGSFLVHAAARYRQALVTALCRQHGLPASEAALNASGELRLELARRYLNDLTTYFFGMELNPFACYLAEMNLLIQGLDDLFVLQQAGQAHPIERFHIYNSDSLDVPREVLDSADVTGAGTVLIQDWLSERLVDEAYPLKARLDDYAPGFFYIISNPPYVSSKQEEFDASRYRNAAFYKAILGGDTNLYLLFLRLGLYYLADYGQMIFILPLTLFGDRSASAARKLLKTPPFSPAALVRFYRGDILFPGVDQAVGIVRINRSTPVDTLVVSGGYTVQEARAAQFSIPAADIIDAVPQNHIWQGNWLVIQSQESLAIWRHIKHVSANLERQLGALLDETFERKQGDVNATYLNPLRLGPGKGSFAKGDVAIYKGEDVRAFTPLPPTPSDWARPLAEGQTDSILRDTLRASEVLKELQQLTGSQQGIILREVARLNTRERLTATWFERNGQAPTAFTHELWRMILKEEASEEMGKALLALLNSSVSAYIVNLFSTNNHVSKDELDRLPIPETQTMPVTQLAALADELLGKRAGLERDFVEPYAARLPDFDEGTVYLPPSAVLAASRLPRVSLQALVLRGLVSNNGPVNGRIRALRARNAIATRLAPTDRNSAAFAQVLQLFLSEPERENETWAQAQSWQLPDTVAASAWLDNYSRLSQQAQAAWEDCIALHRRIDDLVADWYGFDAPMRQAIAEGLPWAKRR